MHTYFEVQLTAPGVTSYGAVWVGFPVLRQCFNDYLGWTQTTNNPDESDLYRLTLKDGGYVLDGQVRQFEVSHEVIKVRQKDGTLRDEPITIRRTVHGPVVAERNGMTVAMRVAAIDRPRLFEQFWKMGLAHNLAEWQAAMRDAAAAAVQHRLRRSRRPHRLRLQRDAAGPHDRRLSVLAGRRARRSIRSDRVDDPAVRGCAQGRSIRRAAGSRTPTTCRGRRPIRRCSTRTKFAPGFAAPIGHHPARAARHAHPELRERAR